MVVLKRLGLPNDLVEPLESSVQGVRAIVGRQLVGFSIKGEAGLGHAIGDPANGGAKVRMPGQIPFEAVEPQGDIRLVARLVGNNPVRDQSAVVGDLHRHAVLVGEGETLNGGAIRQFSERLTADRMGLGRGKQAGHDQGSGHGWLRGRGSLGES